MYAIEVEEEADGRRIAEVPDLPGVLAYGKSRDEAVRMAQVLTLRVLADRLEHGEPPSRRPFACIRVHPRPIKWSRGQRADTRR